jgi:hypothetical protein
MKWISYVVTAGVGTAVTAVTPDVAPYDKTSSSILDFFCAFKVTP